MSSFPVPSSEKKQPRSIPVVVQGFEMSNQTCTSHQHLEPPATVLDISDTPLPPAGQPPADHIMAQHQQYIKYQQQQHQQYQQKQQQYQQKQQQLHPASGTAGSSNSNYYQQPNTNTSTSPYNAPTNTNIPAPPPPPPPEEFTLPPGWQTATRAPDGRIYYYHTETGHTTWDHPAANNISSKAAPAQEEDTSLVDGMITGADGMMSRYGYDEYRQYLPKIATKPAAAAATGAAVGAAAAVGATTGTSATTGTGTAAQTTQTTRDANGADTKQTSLLENVSSNLNKKPNNHTCLLIMALLCCLPLGCCALMHHRNANRNYRNGNYGYATNSSQKATNYSGIACFLGVVGILWYGIRNDWTLPPFLEDLFDF